MLKRIKIQTETVILNDGELGRKIILLQGLSRSELPDKYLEDCPSCYFQGSQDGNTPSLIFTGNTGMHFSICVGEVLKEDYFLKMVARIRHAAARLQKINKIIPFKDKKAKSTQLWII